MAHLARQPIEIESQSQQKRGLCFGLANATVVASVVASVVATLIATAPAVAQEAPSAAELERRIAALAEEIDDLKLGEVASGLESKRGLGPAASKIYGLDRGFSFGGYGEMLYENFGAETQAGDAVARSPQIDFLRQIIYFGYKFDDRLLFNSEIEYEHASTGTRGEVSVEFAYIDYLVRPEFNARAGLLLVPMGWINELHEPPTFLGAQRPTIERVIIPTTWRANGAGIHGEALGASGVRYRAYVIESLSSVDGTNPESFSGAGLRGGRQKGSRALMENVAVVVRADWHGAGAVAGASVFTGNTAQGDTTTTGARFDARTTIYEAHAQVRKHGVHLRGLVTAAWVDEASRINDANQHSGTDGVGSRLFGWYLEAGWDVLTYVSPGTQWSLMPFVRYEQLDTHDQVPDGVVADSENDRQLVTVGMSLFPHPQVVVKADYVFARNDADTGVDQWNLGLGFHF